MATRKRVKKKDDDGIELVADSEPDTDLFDDLRASGRGHVVNPPGSEEIVKQLEADERARLNPPLPEHRVIVGRVRRQK